MIACPGLETEKRPYTASGAKIRSSTDVIGAGVPVLIVTVCKVRTKCNTHPPPCNK